MLLPETKKAEKNKLCFGGNTAPENRVYGSPPNKKGACAKKIYFCKGQDERPPRAPLQKKLFFAGLCETLRCFLLLCSAPPRLLVAVL